MREFINIIEQLNESTGLAGRKPGDVFKNANGDEAVFQDIKFFPKEGAKDTETMALFGQYTYDELDQALAEVEKQIPNIQWQNNRSARTRAFAIISFDKFVIGQYLQAVKPSRNDNYIPNTFVVNGETYKYGGKAAAKAEAGLSPQDLLVDKIDLTVADIMNQLASSLGTDSPLYELAHNIAMGYPLPMTFDAPENVSFTAFRDYFCEILQPIALQKGQYTGNAAEAASKFLGGSFENTLISFDDSKTAGLSDSVMSTADGRSVLVSTKGGKGATASAKNLVDQINQLEETPDGVKFLEKHSEVVDLLREIQQAGQAGAPLLLGVRYDIITPEDADMIRTFKKLGSVSMDNLNQLGLSKNLLALAKSRKTDNPDNVNLYYHLMAAVAHKAAEEVNDKTGFSAAAADILNNGALIQVYTKASEGKGEWTLQEFDTVYPGESIKGVYLSAGKTYYSTGIKGNYTFKIDKGSGKPKDDEAVTPAADISTEPEELSAKATSITNPKRKEPTEKPRPVGDVGRQKRKS
jgi:hypothetical protein